MSRRGSHRRRERRKNRHNPQPEHSNEKAKGHRKGQASGRGSSRRLEQLDKSEKQRWGKYQNEKYRKNYKKIAGFGATSPLRKSIISLIPRYLKLALGVTTKKVFTKVSELLSPDPSPSTPETVQSTPETTQPPSSSTPVSIQPASGRRPTPSKDTRSRTGSAARRRPSSAKGRVLARFSAVGKKGAKASGRKQLLLARDRSVLTAPLTWIVLFIVGFGVVWLMDERTFQESSLVPQLRDLRYGVNYREDMIEDSAAELQSHRIYGAMRSTGLLEVDTRTFRIRNHDRVSTDEQLPSDHLTDVSVPDHGAVAVLADQTKAVSLRNGEGVWKSLIGGGSVTGIDSSKIDQVASMGDQLLMLLEHPLGWALYDRKDRKLSPLELFPALEADETVEDFAIGDDGEGLLLTRRSGSNRGGLWKFHVGDRSLQRSRRKVMEGFGIPLKLVHSGGELLLLTDKGSLLRIVNLARPADDKVVIGGTSFPAFGTEEVEWIGQHGIDGDIWWVQKDHHVGRYIRDGRRWRSLHVSELLLPSESGCRPCILSDGTLIAPKKQGGAVLFSPADEDRTGLAVSEPGVFRERRLLGAVIDPTTKKLQLLVQRLDLAFDQIELHQTEGRNIASIAFDDESLLRIWSDQVLSEPSTPWMDALKKSNGDEVLLVHEDGRGFSYSLENRFLAPSPMQYLLPPDRTISAARRSSKRDYLVIDDGSIRSAVQSGEGRADRQTVPFWPNGGSPGAFGSAKPQRIIGLDDEQLVLFHGPTSPIDSYSLASGIRRPLGSDIRFSSVERISDRSLLALSQSNNGNGWLYQFGTSRAGGLSAGPIKTIEDSTIFRGIDGFGFGTADGNFGTVMLKGGERRRGVPFDSKNRISPPISLVEPLDRETLLIADDLGLLTYRPQERRYRRFHPHSGELDWRKVGRIGKSLLIHSRTSKVLYSISPPLAAGKPNLEQLPGVDRVALLGEKVIVLNRQREVRNYSPSLKNGRFIDIPHPNPEGPEIESYVDLAVIGGAVFIVSDDGKLFRYSSRSSGSEVADAPEDLIDICSSGFRIVVRDKNGNAFVGMDFTPLEIPGKVKIAEIRKGNQPGSFLVRGEDDSLHFIDPMDTQTVIAGGVGEYTGRLPVEWYRSDNRGAWLGRDDGSLLRWDSIARRVIEQVESRGKIRRWIDSPERGSSTVATIWSEDEVYRIAPGQVYSPLSDLSFSWVGRVPGFGLVGAQEDGPWRTVREGSDLVFGNRSASRESVPRRVIEHDGGFLLDLGNQLTHLDLSKIAGGLKDVIPVSSIDALWRLSRNEAAVFDDATVYIVANREERESQTKVKDADAGSGRLAVLLTDGSARLRSKGGMWSDVLSPRSLQREKNLIIQALPDPADPDKVYLLTEKGDLLSHDARVLGATSVLSGVEKLHSSGRVVLVERSGGALEFRTGRGWNSLGVRGITNSGKQHGAAGIHQGRPWHLTPGLTPGPGKVRICWNPQQLEWPTRIEQSASGATGSEIWIAGPASDGVRGAVVSYDVEKGTSASAPDSLDLQGLRQIKQLDSDRRGNLLAVTGSVGGGRLEVRLSSDPGDTLSDPGDTLLGANCGPLQESAQGILTWINRAGEIRSSRSGKSSIRIYKPISVLDRDSSKHLWSVEYAKGMRLHAFGDRNPAQLLLHRSRNNSRPVSLLFNPGLLGRRVPSEVYKIGGGGSDGTHLLVQRATGADRVLSLRGDRLDQYLFVNGDFLGPGQHDLYFRAGEEVRSESIDQPGQIDLILAKEPEPRFDPRGIWRTKDLEIVTDAENLAYRSLATPRARWTNVRLRSRSRGRNLEEVRFEPGVDASSSSIWLRYRDKVTISKDDRGQFAIRSAGFLDVLDQELENLMLRRKGPAGKDREICLLLVGPLGKEEQELRDRWFQSRAGIKFFSFLIRPGVLIPGEVVWDERWQPWRGRYERGFQLQRPAGLQRLPLNSVSSTAFHSVEKVWVTENRSLQVQFRNASTIWRWRPGARSWVRDSSADEMVGDPLSALPGPVGNRFECSGSGDREWTIDLLSNEYEKEQPRALGTAGGEIVVQMADGRWRASPPNFTRPPVAQQRVQKFEFGPPRLPQTGRWEWSYIQNRFEVRRENWARGKKLEVSPEGHGQPAFDHPDDLLPAQNGAYVLCASVLWWCPESGDRFPLKFDVARGSDLGWYLPANSRLAVPALFSTEGTFQLAAAQDPVRVVAGGQRYYRLDPEQISHREVEFSSKGDKLLARVEARVNLAAGGQRPAELRGLHFLHEVADHVEVVPPDLRLHVGDQYTWTIDPLRKRQLSLRRPTVPLQPPDRIPRSGKPEPTFVREGNSYHLEIPGAGGAGSRRSPIRRGAYSIDAPHKFHAAEGEGWLIGAAGDLMFRRRLNDPWKLECLPDLPPGSGDLEAIEWEGGAAWSLLDDGSVLKWNPDDEEWNRESGWGPFGILEIRTRSVGARPSLSFSAVGDQIVPKSPGILAGAKGVELTFDPKLGNFKELVLSGMRMRQTMAGIGTSIAWHSRGGTMQGTHLRWGIGHPLQVPEWPVPHQKAGNSGLGIHVEEGKSIYSICWGSSDRWVDVPGAMRDGLISLHRVVDLATDESRLFLETEAGLVVEGSAAPRLSLVLEPSAMNQSQKRTPDDIEFLETPKQLLAKLGNTGGIFKHDSGGSWSEATREEWQMERAEVERKAGKQHPFSWQATDGIVHFQLDTAGGKRVPLEINAGRFNFDAPRSLRPVRSGNLLEISEGGKSRFYLEENTKPWIVEPVADQPPTEAVIKPCIDSSLWGGPQSKSYTLSLLQGKDVFVLREDGSLVGAKFEKNPQNMVTGIEAVSSFPFEVEKNSSATTVIWKSGWRGTLDEDGGRATFRHDRTRDLAIIAGKMRVATDGGTFERDLEKGSWLVPAGPSNFSRFDRVLDHRAGGNWYVRLRRNGVWIDSGGKPTPTKDVPEEVISEKPWLKIVRGRESPEAWRIDSNGAVHKRLEQDEVRVFPLPWDRIDAIARLGDRILRLTDRFWESHPMNPGLGPRLGPYDGKLEGPFRSYEMASTATELHLKSGQGTWHRFTGDELLVVDQPALQDRKWIVERADSVGGKPGIVKLSILGPSVDGKTKLQTRDLSGRDIEPRESWSKMGFPWDEVSDAIINEGQLFSINEVLLEEIPVVDNGSGHPYGRLFSDPKLGLEPDAKWLLADSYGTDDLYLRDPEDGFHRLEPKSLEWFDIDGEIWTVLARWSGGGMTRLDGGLRYSDQRLGIVEAYGDSETDQIFANGRFSWDDVQNLSGPWLQSSYRHHQKFDRDFGYRVETELNPENASDWSWRPGDHIRFDSSQGEVVATADAENGAQLTLAGTVLRETRQEQRLHFRHQDRLWLVDPSGIRWLRLENRWLERALEECKQEEPN